MFEVDVNATFHWEPTLIHVITTAPTAASSPTDTGTHLCVCSTAQSRSKWGLLRCAMERLERVLTDFTVEQMKDSAPAAETQFLHEEPSKIPG